MVESPKTPSAASSEAEARMPFGDHLEELRNCLIRSLVGWGICTVLALLFARRLLEIVIAPVQLVLNAHGESPELLSLNPPDLFMLYIKSGLLAGLILSMPWILYQLWSFVSTGLYSSEKRLVRGFLPVSMGLFVFGVLFMFFIVLPVVLNFLIGFAMSFDQASLNPNAFERLVLGIESSDAPTPTVQLDVSLPLLNYDPVEPPAGALWLDTRTDTLRVATPDGVRELVTRLNRPIRTSYSIQFFVSFVMLMALGFGLAFELPVVVVALAATGIVSVAEMSKVRRYVLFGIVVMAAILTPPDVISQVLLAIPMYALFEAGLIAARRFEPDKSRSA